MRETTVLLLSSVLLFAYASIHSRIAGADHAPAPVAAAVFISIVTSIVKKPIPAYIDICKPSAGRKGAGTVMNGFSFPVSCGVSDKGT